MDEGRIRNAMELEQTGGGEITRKLWEDLILHQGQDFADNLLMEYASREGYLAHLSSNEGKWQVIQSLLEEQWAILSSFPTRKKEVRFTEEEKARGTDGPLWWYSGDTDSRRSEGFGEYFYGLPQGLPTSPLLSIFALNEAFTSRYKNQVAYADDFIVYGQTASECEVPITDRMRACNIRINEEKSGWVKKNGKWLKPLQFLGMTYDGKVFRASTRKGSTVEFTSLESLCAWLKGGEGSSF